MNSLTSAITRLLLSGPGLTHLDSGLSLTYVVVGPRHTLALSRHFAAITGEETHQAIQAIARRTGIEPTLDVDNPLHIELAFDVDGPLHIVRLKWTGP